MRTVPGFSYETVSDVDLAIRFLRETADNLEKQQAYLKSVRIDVEHETNAYDIRDIRMQPVEVINHKTLTVKVQEWRR